MDITNKNPGTEEIIYYLVQFVLIVIVIIAFILISVFIYNTFFCAESCENFTAYGQVKLIDPNPTDNPLLYNQPVDTNQLPSHYINPSESIRDDTLIQVMDTMGNVRYIFLSTIRNTLSKDLNNIATIPITASDGTIIQIKVCELQNIINKNIIPPKFNVGNEYIVDGISSESISNKISKSLYNKYEDFSYPSNYNQYVNGRSRNNNTYSYNSKTSDPDLWTSNKCLLESGKIPDMDNFISTNITNSTNIANAVAASSFLI